MDFKCGKYYVSVDSSYVLIATKPLDMLTDKDFENDNIVTGFDRCDGINYYKSFKDQRVVKKITEVITNHNILPTDMRGNIITAVDED